MGPEDQHEQPFNQADYEKWMTENAVIRAAKALVLAMETCHICSGTVLLDEWPVHCEDCSADCEEHEPPDCPTIQSLHAALKKALSTSKQEISGLGPRSPKVRRRDT